MKTNKGMTALKRLKVIAIFSMVVSVIMLAAYPKEVGFLYNILPWEDNKISMEQNEEIDVEDQEYSIEPMSENNTIFYEIDAEFSDERKLKIARGLFWFAYGVWNFLNISFIIDIKENDLKKGFFEGIMEKGRKKYGGFK